MMGTLQKPRRYRPASPPPRVALNRRNNIVQLCLVVPRRSRLPEVPQIELVDVLAKPSTHTRLCHSAWVRHVRAQVFEAVWRRRLVVGPRHLPPPVNGVELLELIDEDLVDADAAWVAIELELTIRVPTRWRWRPRQASARFRVNDPRAPDPYPVPTRSHL